MFSAAYAASEMSLPENYLAILSIIISARICYNLLMKKVIIYSTPTCHYCQMAKEFFKENNVAYEERDVASDQAHRKEMVDKSGQLGVPVMDIEGRIVVGFDKSAVAKELGI